LARRAGLTLIGRAKGKRFIALSGIDRIVFDSGDDDEFADALSMQRARQGTGR
jgi:FdhD protein